MPCARGPTSRNRGRALGPSDLRQKVWDVCLYIQENLYLNRPDLEVGGVRLNSALLMSLLTALCQGKALVIGEPGLGKTTSAEYVGALVYQFPLGALWRAEVSGHPEQTEEKIIGRPDLGRLNQGEEVVVWSHFALLPVKIVDELNRLPETKQSLILDGVDRGNWTYLDDAIMNDDYCLFATANYADRGTNTVIAPLLDRFDVMLESKHPGANLAYLIAVQRSRALALRHPRLEEELRRVLSHRIGHEALMTKVDGACAEFGAALAEDFGIPSLFREERAEIRTRIRSIPFGLDFNAFLRFTVAELSFCYRFGQKRTNETCEEGCHFTGYLCGAVNSCISNRFPASAATFAQALAWLLGEAEVGIEQLTTVLPFTLAHRIRWKEAALAQAEGERRTDPLEIFMAKGAVRQLHRRYSEQHDEIKAALSVAGQRVEGDAPIPIEGDHPLYWEIRRDLGEDLFGP